MLWVIGVFLVGFSSILGGMNYLATTLNKRAKGMRMFDMPLTVWALSLHPSFKYWVRPYLLLRCLCFLLIKRSSA